VHDRLLPGARCRCPAGRRYRRLAGIQLAVLLLANAPDFAAGQDIDDDQVKAVFLYRLTKFVEWPEDASAQAPLTVCVIGNNALADLLEGVAKPQPTSDRGFAVRRINGASEARNCQVLYLAASQRRRVRAILSAISGSGILTIGETEGFTIQGCVIDFWIEANKLRFEVNTNAAARAHLKISSKLLSLAARVVKSDW
jgi:hypothetical protein